MSVKNVNIGKHASDLELSQTEIEMRLYTLDTSNYSK